jgi:predicted metal-binding membrane protein
MDWGMRHMDVGMAMVIMPAIQNWTAWDLVLVFLMWAVMMVAMMVPAVSPVILLFAEINRRQYNIRCASCCVFDPLEWIEQLRVWKGHGISYRLRYARKLVEKVIRTLT